MTETRSLRRWIAVVGSGVILAFAASSAYDAWRLHQQVTQSTGRELSNLARALSEEAERSLQAVDLLLTDTAIWYRDKGARQTGADIENALRMRASATPQVSVLTITDADGRQRYRSRQTGEPLADVSDRPYFETQRDSRVAGLFINPPIVTRSERRAALVVSRRLETPSGAFAGVVTAIVTLDELREVYNAIDLGAGSALILTFDDGRLVVRQPPDPRADGQVFSDLTSQQASAPRIARSPVDGREKFIVSLPVSDRPLMMSVTKDAHEAMAPWRAEMVGLALRTLALVAVGLLTMSLMLRQLLRVERGEQALRRSEQRYALAMEAANEGHAEWNLQENSFFASERWLRLHGAAPSARPMEARALFLSLDLHPDDRPVVTDSLHEHLAGRTPELDIEYRVRLSGGGTRPADERRDSASGAKREVGNEAANETLSDTLDDGEDDTVWRWLHLRGRCLSDAAGRPTRFSCAAMDITPRKDAEAERERLQAQLRTAQHMESLGTLAGGIAHDFNNILGAILGHGEMAQRRAGTANADLARHLDRIMQAGARARLLVRRILDFSRSGVHDRSLVNVDQAVEEALQLVTPTLPADVELHTALRGGNAGLLGDVLQMQQLVSNLCSNAVGAMPGGGRLGLSVDVLVRAQPVLLSHGTLPPGRYAEVRVSDTGTGIAPDVYGRMFDPFFSTKAVGEGTGLGLSVVHSIVADMGGAIDVRTEPGRGSSFALWFPVAGEAPRALRSNDAEAPPRGDGQTLLIVDDEAPLREFAEELLAELGYEPVGFPSAEAALVAFERAPQRFDAVLTDETMPGMSGVELAKRLLARRPGLPVLVMSGYGGEELEARVAASGARELVRKPLSAAELAQAVSRVLGASAVSAETSGSPGVTAR
ncbi:ATP-binding protein [Roseateles sp. UC29_93]|uniref:ATP-binding protein n=1 Tax=Roseateles sp. UC29_93 TaxID=3350177 RepID=UPI00366FA55A